MRSLNVQNVADLNPTVLLADDEEFNLEILEELLEDAGYETDRAHNGREALELLRANPEKYQAVLLDRMMPDMGGMEVIEIMQQDRQLSRIPVIMQTAKATRQDIEEGLEAGILYYLTKPFAKDELFAIVDTAVRYFHECRELVEKLQSHGGEVESEGVIEFETIDQARDTAVRLATLAAQPARVVTGLLELLVNAIEHGNLGIGFELKSELQHNGDWAKEIKNRLSLPENRGKKARVSYSVNGGVVRYCVCDEGAGFNYREYLEINTARNLNIYGRGIAIARVLSFDKLSYTAPGNQVTAEVDARPANGDITAGQVRST
ncbi:MAG: response regulator [Gammaproteobacteria bacterium]|jgi:CheY-like chemotaxis protein